jgi:hypothetical protein
LDLQQPRLQVRLVEQIKRGAELACERHGVTPAKFEVVLLIDARTARK